MNAPTLIAGIDEVGRGALAGPILSVCALFKFDCVVRMGAPPVEHLKDSKAFSTSAAREKVWNEIIDSPYLVDFNVGECSVEEINECGIDRCNSTIFQRAIVGLRAVPEFIYVDGDRPIPGWPKERQHVEPKADAKYWPVSAASVLAKVIRDRLMLELDRRYPNYGWSSNKGYGSAKHQEGLLKFGPTEHHRRKFIQNILEKR